MRLLGGVHIAIVDLANGKRYEHNDGYDPVRLMGFVNIMCLYSDRYTTISFIFARPRCFFLFYWFLFVLVSN